MGFKYVLIPCSPNDAIQELEFPESIDSLEKDTFRTFIEKYFQNASSGTLDKEVLFKQLKERTGVDVAEKASNGEIAPEALDAIIAQTSVEIFPVMMPTKDTGFQGISFYCDDKGVAKSLEENLRASSLAQVAGYAGQVFRGDIVIGKIEDDNEDVWKRIDFSMSDVNAEADWVKMTKKQRSNRSSGDMQKMAAQFGANNAVNINPSTMPQDDPMGETDAYTWKQKGDEVEVTFKKEGLKKGDKNLVKATFSRKRVQVIVAGETLLDGEMHSNLDTDCCTWTLSDGVLQLSLTKEDEDETWPSLLK